MATEGGDGQVGSINDCAARTGEERVCYSNSQKKNE